MKPANSYPRLLLLLLPLLLMAACAQKETLPSGPGNATPATLTISSPDFAAGQAIPSTYTCDGSDSSPALKWPAAPSGTQSLALIMDDPDAPVGTWVHWVVYNLPPDTGELAAGASQAKAATFNLPAGALQGVSSFKRSDYGGPCPPSGTHRYFFRVYALDTNISQPGLDKAKLLEAMQGHILASGELMGTYTKK